MGEGQSVTCGADDAWSTLGIGMDGGGCGSTMERGAAAACPEEAGREESPMGGGGTVESVPRNDGCHFIATECLATGTNTKAKARVIEHVPTMGARRWKEATVARHFLTGGEQDTTGKMDGKKGEKETKQGLEE